jgi:hypothetical protein
MCQTVGYRTRNSNDRLSKKKLLVVNFYVSGPSVHSFEICEKFLDTATNLLGWRIFRGVLIPEQIAVKIILITVQYIALLAKRNTRCFCGDI